MTWPRVAAQRLPWVARRNDTVNPEGVESVGPSSPHLSLVALGSGWNPVGVWGLGRFQCPRAAAARQPWATRWDAFSVRPRQPKSNGNRLRNLAQPCRPFTIPDRIRRPKSENL